MAQFSADGATAAMNAYDVMKRLGNCSHCRVEPRVEITFAHNIGHLFCQEGFQFKVACNCKPWFWESEPFHPVLGPPDHNYLKARDAMLLAYRKHCWKKVENL